MKTYKDTNLVSLQDKNEDWSRAIFHKCKIKDSFLDEEDCTEVFFDNCELLNVDFSLTYLWSGLFSGSNLVKCNFDKTKLQDAKFVACIFRDVEFFALEHKDTLVFEKCKFERCKFLGMTEEDFEGTSWLDCTFDRKTLASFPKNFFNEKLLTHKKV